MQAIWVGQGWLGPLEFVFSARQTNLAQLAAADLARPNYNSKAEPSIKQPNEIIKKN